MACPIHAFRKNGRFCSPAGYAAESRGFAELGMTSESEALRSIFFGQTACKKNPYPKSKCVPFWLGGSPPFPLEALYVT